MPGGDCRPMCAHMSAPQVALVRCWRELKCVYAKEHERVTLRAFDSADAIPRLTALMGVILAWPYFYISYSSIRANNCMKNRVRLV